MKITIIAGARPNFMKIAPLMRAIDMTQKQGKPIEARLVYTGCQQDNSLEDSLFEDLDMPHPDTCLEVESNDFFQRLAGIIVAFSQELDAHPTDIVMVVDDLTPTMACTIVARKKGIKVAHLVAGIRSFDMNMPKEVNRMITDGLSDILFTASMSANRNLNQTGTEQKHVHFVGNILMDTLRHNAKRLVKPSFMHTLGLTEKGYLLLTINRHALLKDEDKLKTLFNTLMEHTDLPIVAPLRGYVKEKLDEWGIHSTRLHLLPPQPYLAFGYLVNHAKAIVTDSGNIAEEATFLNLPCITLNSYAEHPETVTIGTNQLVGEDPQALADALDTLSQGRWKKGHLPERWDGRTAERIVQTLLDIFE
jgi:UDP-N-acetylglucosamine 2-epimerase (non-hydrolysing)